MSRDLQRRMVALEQSAERTEQAVTRAEKTAKAPTPLRDVLHAPILDSLSLLAACLVIGDGWDPDPVAEEAKA